MNKWKTRGLRVFRLVAGLTIASGLLSLVPISTASATPIVHEVSVVSAASVVATEVSTAADVLFAPVAKKTPVTDHCGEKMRWKLYYKMDTKYLKIRTWYFNDNRMTRHFCNYIRKVSPKSKVKIGFNFESSDYKTTTSSKLSMYCVAGRDSVAKWIGPYYGKKDPTWYPLHPYYTMH